jgi:hypothetical protein
MVSAVEERHLALVNFGQYQRMRDSDLPAHPGAARPRVDQELLADLAGTDRLTGC